MIFKLVLFCSFVLLPGETALADTCERWFLKSGLKPGTKTCELNCATIPVDMGTFDCPAQCDKLCKTYIKPDTIPEIARYIEPRALTPEEHSLIAKYPADAVKVYFAKQKASVSTKRIFEGNFRNDESDAYRHFLWSGLLHEQIGKDRAEAFLDAHEAGTGGPEVEKVMDQFNNKRGIEAAEKLLAQGEFSQDALERAAINSLKRKDLKVLSPSGRIPEWKK